MHSGIFHVGVAIFRAWQTTVQVGMAAWRELQRFRRQRNSQKHYAMEALFLDIRSQGELFCSSNGSIPRWKPTPHHEFLSKEFFSRFWSTRIFRQGGPLGDEQGYGSVSASGSSGGSRGEAERATPTVDSAGWAQAQAENLAEDFIMQVMADLQREVTEEESDSSRPGDLQDQVDLQAQAEFWASTSATER